MFFSTIKLRLAKLEDIDLIHQTILSDASKGHYSRDYLSGDEAKLALKTNLNSMILNKIRYQTIWYNNKLLDRRLNARVIIAEKNNKTIGFSIISETDSPKDIEIYKFSIFNDVRNKGYGKKFLKELIKSIQRDNPNSNFVARCFESSKIMMNMLQDNKFIEENSVYETRFFRLKPS